MDERLLVTGLITGMITGSKLDDRPARGGTWAGSFPSMARKKEKVGDVSGT